MAYRVAEVGKVRRMTLPYMPTAASERALMGGSLVAPFGTIITLAGIGSSALLVVGLASLSTAGAMLYSARRGPLRFALDDIALSVQWPPGAELGSHCTIPREELRHLTLTFGFELGLATTSGRIPLNQAPTFRQLEPMARRLSAFLGGLPIIAGG